MIKIDCNESNNVGYAHVELAGDLDVIVGQIGYAIKSAYTKIREQDKNTAELFRIKVIHMIAAKNAETWKRDTCEDATCRAAIVRKGAKLTGDDIADLLRRGTPTHIVKALLEEMEA